MGCGALGLALLAGYWVFQPDPVDELSSSDRDARRGAVAAMSASADKPSGVRRIAEAVKHENPTVACRALRALAAGSGANKPLSEEGRKVAEAAARDSRPVVCVAAVQVLEATTPPLPEDTAVPETVLKVLVEADEPSVRAAAARALGKFQYWRAMEPLLDAMADDSAEVRGAAGRAVRQILGLDYGFRAEASLPDRQAALARLRSGWRSSKRYHEEHARRVREARKAGS